MLKTDYYNYFAKSSDTQNKNKKILKNWLSELFTKSSNTQNKS